MLCCICIMNFHGLFFLLPFGITQQVSVLPVLKSQLQDIKYANFFHHYNESRVFKVVKLVTI